MLSLLEQLWSCDLTFLRVYFTLVMKFFSSLACMVGVTTAVVAAEDPRKRTCAHSHANSLR